MKWILFFLFPVLFVYSPKSKGQRPDLIIGAHISQQILTEPYLRQTYYTPGIAFDLEVSKHRIAGKISLGMQGALSQKKQENPGQFNQYFINLGLSCGVFLLKRPSFKWRLNVLATNLFNLNNYRLGSSFNLPNYTLQASPEFFFRYRHYCASVYYSFPVTGFAGRGTGVTLGVGF